MLKFQMHPNLLSAYKFFGQGITVHIYAYPNFILELLLAILLVGVYIFLSYEVSRIYKETVKLRPHTIHLSSLKGDFSKDSICTSITRIEHEFCKFDLIQKNNPNYSVTKRSRRTSSNTSVTIDFLKSGQDLLAPIYEKQQNDKIIIEKLAALTPAQFVKLDKKRQIRERQINGCMRSLTTLFDNIVAKKYPSTVLQEQIETAKEETVCARVSDQVMKYLDSESVTESLINVLNDIVEGTSMENPFPVQGDYTSLAYDVGNLKEQSELIYDTKCELVESASTNSSKFNTSVDDRDEEYPLI